MEQWACVCMCCESWRRVQECVYRWLRLDESLPRGTMLLFSLGHQMQHVNTHMGALRVLWMQIRLRINRLFITAVCACVCERVRESGDRYSGFFFFFFFKANVCIQFRIKATWQTSSPKSWNEELSFCVSWDAPAAEAYFVMIRRADLSAACKLDVFVRTPVFCLCWAYITKAISKGLRGQR